MPRGHESSLRFAGFLPVTRHRRDWWVLLGKEHDGWGVFGGGPEAEDGGDPVRTAVREAHEESHGLLLMACLEAAARAVPPLIQERRACIFGVYVPWSLCRRLNAVLRRQQDDGMKPLRGCYEKTQVLWVRARALAGILLPLRHRLLLNLDEDTTAQNLARLKKKFQKEEWSEEILRVSETNMTKLCAALRPLAQEPR